MAEEIIGGSFILNTEDLNAGVAEASRQFKLLDSEARRVQSSFDDWTKSQEGLQAEVDKLTQRLRIQSQIVEAYSDKLKKLQTQEGASAEEIRNTEIKLNQAQTSYNKLQRALDKYQGQLDSLKKSQDKASDSTENLDKKQTALQKTAKTLDTVLKTGIVLTIGRTLVNAANNAIKAMIEYESAFTDVRKTVDGTEEDFERLNSEINQMARTMPQSASDIAQVVALGGQLGIAAEDLTSFARTMIMLGDSTDLTAESAAEMIAQLGNITGLRADDYERFGSTLVDLGNKSAATESAILEMANRIARFGSTVGLSNQNILALSSALASMGVEAEAGSSSMQRLFSEMQLASETGSEMLSMFAEIAGFTEDEFAKAFEDDALGAMTAFVKGLQTADKQGRSTIAILDEMGMTDVRLSQNIQALVAGYDTLASSISIADSAWEENTALSTEANTRYKTLASQVEITKNRFNELARTIASEYSPAVEALVLGAGNVATQLLGIIDPLEGSEIALENAKTAFEQYKQSLDDASGSADSMTESQKALNSELLIAAVQGIVDSWITLTGTIRQADNELRGVENTIEKLTTSAGTDTLGGLFLKAAQDIDKSVTTLAEAEELAANIATNTHGASKREIKELTKLYGQYNEVKERGIDWSEKQAQAEAKITASMEYLAEQVRAGTLDIRLLQAINEEYAAEVERLVPVLQKRADEEARQAELYDATLSAQKAHLEAQSAMMANEESYRSMLEMSRDSFTALIAEVEEGSDEYIKLSARLDAVNAALSDYSKTTQDAANSTEGLGTALEEFNIATYIQRFGTEADKTKLQISSLEGEITALENAIAGETDTSKIDSMRYAISLLQAEIGRLKTPSISAPTVKGGGFDLSGYITSYGTDAEKEQAAISESIEKINDDIRAMTAERTAAIQAGNQEYADQLSALIDAAFAQKSGLLTKEGEKSAKEFLDGFNKMFTSDSGFATDITPFVQSLQTALGNVIDPLRDVYSSVWDYVLQGFETEVSGIESQLDALESKSQAALDKVASDAETRQSVLDDQYKAGEITQAEYYRQTARLQEDQAEQEQKIREENAEQEAKLRQQKDEAERKAFEAQKANAIAQVWINAASATIRAFAENFWPVALGITAAIATAAGVQTATIASQKYVPALAEGGVVSSPTLALIGEENGGSKEAVLPLERHTEWMDVLGGKVADAIERREASSIVNNTASTDNRSYTINQQIAASHVPTRREAYLQARRALKEVR